MKNPVTHYITDSFQLCTGSIEPSEKFYNPNKDAGDLNQFAYLFSGDADANGLQIVVGLNDVSSLAGRKILYVGGSNGASWVCVNPTPVTNRFNCEVLQNTTVIVNADGKNKTIVPIKNTAIANGQEILTFGHAKIPKNKSVEIVVPEGSICLLLTQIESVTESAIPVYANGLLVTTYE
jgi:hypothetical protein